MIDINTAETTVDLLTHAVAVTRRHIEVATTPHARLRALWAGAKHARDMASSDVVADEFLQLAKAMGLANGRHADEDVRHVLNWASRGMDPFGRGAVQ